MTYRSMRVGLVLAAMALVAGCDKSTTSPAAAPAASATPAVAEGPFGPANMLPIMNPFGGEWRFDLEKTLAQVKADGVPAKEIDDARAFAKSFPLHEDMSIAGDTAVLHGHAEGEYKFFALHPHGRRVCGKAWHHEDRFDPGDMSKCLARLEIRDAELHLSLRHHEDAADPNDPEVATPPSLAGSAATCTADAEKDPPWSAWRTYVFERTPSRGK